MSIEQVNLLERNKNYVRPYTNEEWGYRLFCGGWTLPENCSADIMRGWVRAWRNDDPFNFDRNPALKNVQPAEYREDWVGA
jgi:hypothetical protein